MKILPPELIDEVLEVDRSSCKPFLAPGTDPDRWMRLAGSTQMVAVTTGEYGTILLEPLEAHRTLGNLSLVLQLSDSVLLQLTDSVLQLSGPILVNLTSDLQILVDHIKNIWQLLLPEQK